MLALYAPAIFFDGLLQKSVLDVFFVCLALWLIATDNRNRRDRRERREQRSLCDLRDLRVRTSCLVSRSGLAMGGWR